MSKNMFDCLRDVEIIQEEVEPSPQQQQTEQQTEQQQQQQTEQQQQQLEQKQCQQQAKQQQQQLQQQQRMRRPQQQQQQALNMLEKGGVELCEFQQMEWVPLPKPLVIDSGAGETVIPTDWLPAHPTQESPGSRVNEFYTTADGTKVYNEGQKELVISSLDGEQCREMTFQVAGVNKALGSVNQMVRKGNRVVFDEDEHGRDISYIMHKATQQKMHLRAENGVYVLDMLVAPPGYKQQLMQKQFSKAGGFGRQGK